MVTTAKPVVVFPPKEIHRQHLIWIVHGPEPCYNGLTSWERTDWMPDIVTQLRQNHALEHATMHILSRQNPQIRLMGRSTLSGFLIYGLVDTEDIVDAASEGLARLQQGEGHLAVHPHCGTNLAVTGLLAGAAAFSVSLGRSRSRLDRLPVALMAATLAAVVAQPLAHRIQERITTTPDVDGIYIVGATRRKRGRLMGHHILVGRE